MTINHQHLTIPCSDTIYYKTNFLQFQGLIGRDSRRELGSEIHRCIVLRQTTHKALAKPAGSRHEPNADHTTLAELFIPNFLPS